MRRKIMFISGALLCLWVIYLFKVPPTSSKFLSNLESNAKGGIAFYVVEPGYQNTEIKLDEIVPNDDFYVYEFSVANYNDEKRLETNAEYNVVIRTTTNLNLEYYLYMNNGASDIILERQYVQDEDGTYYYIMKTKKESFGFQNNQINNYKLLIKFPTTYISHQYQNIMESIEIIISSSQVIK